MRNGISAAGVSELVHEVRERRSQGCATYGVNVRWLSGTRAEVSTLPMMLGDQSIHRGFQWGVDEPKQLGGTNHSANPQEYLLGGFGSCLMVAFLVGASISGIQLSHLQIEVRSELDLAGFLSIAADALVPLKAIQYVVRVAGDGTAEQFESIRQAAQAHSPNAMSLARGVTVEGMLEVL